MSSHNRLVRAYVDETGDRGTGPRASQFFAMAGVAVADEDELAMRQAVHGCRVELAVPATKHLHWVEAAKSFDRRQFITSQLAGLPGLVVNYVIFEKAAIPATAQLGSDHVTFYNYCAGLMLERLLLTARDWPGGPRQLIATFGHVKGFDHGRTSDYFVRKRASGPSWMPWQQLHGRPRFADAGAYDGLQVADQYAGMLAKALCADRYGGYEAAHLLAIRHQIRRVGGRSWGYGFKVMGRANLMEGYPWWPSGGL